MKFKQQKYNFDDYPCRYSIDEIKERARKALMEARAGKVTSHEEMYKK